MITLKVSTTLLTSLLIATSLGSAADRVDPWDIASNSQALSGTDQRAQRLSGDFNGDGREDVLIVTGSGTYEYLGQAGSGFGQNVWIRKDLTLGSVAYF